MVVGYHQVATCLLVCSLFYKKKYHGTVNRKQKLLLCYKILVEYEYNIKHPNNFNNDGVFIWAGLYFKGAGFNLL